MKIEIGRLVKTKVNDQGIATFGHYRFRKDGAVGQVIDKTSNGDGWVVRHGVTRDCSAYLASELQPIRQSHSTDEEFKYMLVHGPTPKEFSHILECSDCLAMAKAVKENS